MNKESIERVKKLSMDIAALYYDILPNLPIDHQKAIIRLCGRISLTAIKIIDVIDGKEKTYAEIANELEINKNTIKQYCYALSESFPIKCDAEVAIAKTGRGQKLIKSK